MATLGLTLPREVIQSELRAYQLFIRGQVAVIEQPVAGRKILSVYRGTGPRHHPGEPLSSFDGFLLSQAIAAGAHHVPARVRKVTWDDRPIVHTDRGTQPAELLVLATGVNARPPLDASFGYQPPGSAVMAQDEILRPEGWPEDTVAGFFGEPPGLLFGALVPKGAYLNVSLLWRDAPAHAIQQFYEAQSRILSDLFPSAPRSFCGCNPRILTGPATVYYGDRWVSVGDAVAAPVQGWHQFGFHYGPGAMTAPCRRASAARTSERGTGRSAPSSPPITGTARCCIRCLASFDLAELRDGFCGVRAHRNGAEPGGTRILPACCGGC